MVALTLFLLAFGITPSLAALPGPGQACHPFTTTKYNWSAKCGKPSACGVYGTKVCHYHERQVAQMTSLPMRLGLNEETSVLSV
jgi:hypothetical protein